MTLRDLSMPCAPPTPRPDPRRDGLSPCSGPGVRPREGMCAGCGGGGGIAGCAAVPVSRQARSRALPEHRQGELRVRGRIRGSILRPGHTVRQGRRAGPRPSASERTATVPIRRRAPGAPLRRRRFPCGRQIGYRTAGPAAEGGSVRHAPIGLRSDPRNPGRAPIRPRGAGLSGAAPIGHRQAPGERCGPDRRHECGEAWQRGASGAIRMETGSGRTRDNRLRMPKITKDQPYRLAVAPMMDWKDFI